MINDYLWWGIAAVAVAAFVLLRRPRKVQEAPPLAIAAKAPAPASVQPEPAARPRPPAPEALLAFRPTHADELSPERRRDLFTLFRKVPRPPALLQQLLSPDFLNTASSAQLVDLIATEPLIAARLLAVVNSPAYGLQRPAASIDQAVMVLGVNGVRSICLRYLMLAAFSTDDPARAARLEASWRASGIASELARHLCQALHFDAAGATVSALVLSFLGRLAIEGGATAEELATIPREGLLARSIAEQAALGLPAAEIGRLLMTEWGLPPTLVADAADIDSLLTSPPDPRWPDREGRLALAYFCARVGERLADGAPATLEGLAVLDEAPADFFHFRAYLAHPWLRNLESALQDPALAERLQQLKTVQA